MNPEENIQKPLMEPYIQTIPTPPMKIGKFRGSRMIVQESWSVLKQDKEIMWFPILSALSSFFALVIIGLLLFFIVLGGDIHPSDNANEYEPGVLGYVIIFIYYLIMFFITNFFLAGIYIIVSGRFRGQNLSLKDGINGATRNIGKIFIWSVISSTIGVILQIIAERFKIVGRIVASLLGATWGILTYFSLPSLIIGQKTVRESFKESAALIRKTWGEVIIVNFGVGLFFGIILFLGMALSIGIVVLVPFKVVFILVSILFIIFIITITIISSALNSIFKLALYEFALTGNIPRGFTPDLIKGAIKAGKQI